jgi:hypothetical protein
MNTHVGNILYGYATGELGETERARVEGHLAGCPSCTADLAHIRSALRFLPRPAGPPSEERDSAFWTAFANEVEARIIADRRRQPSLTGAMRDQIASFVSFNRASLLAGAGTLATIAAAVLLLWPRAAAVREPERIAVAQTRVLTTNEPAQRMNDYLKRSKVLLVGIANMKTDDGHPLDLSLERRQSRALVHEARYLRQQPMDGRSARLIGDLEKILIELANIEEHQDLPNVELIRTGIRRENLLFKIRMAETLLEAEEHERERP